MAHFRQHRRQCVLANGILANAERHLPGLNGLLAGLDGTGQLCVTPSAKQRPRQLRAAHGVGPSDARQLCQHRVQGHKLKPLASERSKDILWHESARNHRR